MSKSIRVTLDRAIQMLPRYNHLSRKVSNWTVDGDRLQTNAQILPDAVDKGMRKIMKEVARRHFKDKIEYVDVSGNDVWVVHRHLATSNLLWLAKRDWNKLQHWPNSKLPTYLRWKGRIIIWNGTHRMTIARLRGLKVRARVFDLNEYAEWQKTHPYGWDAKKVRPKKAKARGNR